MFLTLTMRMSAARKAMPANDPSSMSVLTPVLNRASMIASLALTMTGLPALRSDSNKLLNSEQISFAICGFPPKYPIRLLRIFERLGCWMKACGTFYAILAREKAALTLTLSLVSLSSFKNYVKAFRVRSEITLLSRPSSRQVKALILACLFFQSLSDIVELMKFRTNCLISSPLVSPRAHKAR